ncbi:DUF3311 domain-containing protein [Streptomyces odontomachi]|uniref:DUF3311 domain-containing protein n=1 Tax=Streptomyces odontomachi TaxID=2944940 RepID=UPI00210E519B|nr:DUF3311 domain-containing protein [Streptomyces sp. ODS25]
MTRSIESERGSGGGSSGHGSGSKGLLILRVVLSVVPFLGMCGAVPLVNQVEPYVLGMPFLVFWIGAWTVLTSVCMGLVHLLAPAATVADEGRRS